MVRKKSRLGSTFESYLAEAGLLGSVTATAMKRVLVWQITQTMKKKRLTKAEMAKRMKTSRAALDRLLDGDNTSITLSTMSRAAAALGKTLSISFKDAARE